MALYTASLGQVALHSAIGRLYFINHGHNVLDHVLLALGTVEQNCGPHELE